MAVKKKTQLNMQLSYDPAIAFLGIYSREIKLYVYTKTSIQMFIVALFMITPKWKQPLSGTNLQQIND